MCTTDGIPRLVQDCGQRHPRVQAVWECGCGACCRSGSEGSGPHTEHAVATAGGTHDAALDALAIRTIRRRLRQWGRQHYVAYPWRAAAREWHGLVAEVLLQRARATSVVSVYDAFVARFPDPGDLAAAAPEAVEALLRPLGLRWRAPLLHRLGVALAARKGRVPHTLEGLTALPGVGPYAAAAFVSLHGGRRAVLIDANVVRWVCRLTGQSYDGETRRKRWLRTLADTLTPARRVREFNYALLDFTMEVCSVRPQCGQCPLGAGLCAYARSEMSRP